MHKPYVIPNWIAIKNPILLDNKKSNELNNKVLTKEHPLLILPELAVKVGLNEAIFLQQLHYWLNKSPSKFDKNKHWIYNSYQEWNKQFPFWSESTIRRVISILEKKEYIFTKNLNKNAFNKTKWYSINYSKLDSIGIDLSNNKNRKEEIDQSIRSNCSDYALKMNRSNIETENTTENNKTNILSFLRLNNNKIELSNKTNIEREMLNIWNEVVEEGLKHIHLTEKRAKILFQKLKNPFNNDLSKWKEFCNKIASSKFLMGEITNFKANIDWALKEENIIKIQEGAYKTGDRVNEQQALIEDNLENMMATEECSEELKLLKHDLLNHIGKSTYKSWFKEVVFIDTDPKALKLKAPTRFISSYIEQHYLAKINQLYEVITGKRVRNIEICYT